MKRLFGILLLSSLLFGCGTAAKQSELWQHDTQFKNWEHTKFSLWQYKNPTAETYKKSMEQRWWGVEVPYIPAD